ncbi:hypothetical protein [Calothrix sp. NIES-3974]|nr:hypothetical protein [Calothrix sp. NIES-3974]
MSNILNRVLCTSVEKASRLFCAEVARTPVLFSACYTNNARGSENR